MSVSRYEDDGISIPPFLAVAKPRKAGSKSPINFSYRKVGGLTFVKLGRLTFSFSVSKAYSPL